MNAKTVATVIAVHTPNSVQRLHQRNFTQLAGPQGRKLYVENATKGENIRRVELSGWAYRGLPAGLELPATAVRPVDDNGAVSLRVDLDALAPAQAADWLARALAALTAAGESDPRRQARRRGGSGRVAPDMAQLIAQAEADARRDASSHASPAPSDASAEAQSDAAQDADPDAMSDEELEAATAPAIGEAV